MSKQILMIVSVLLAMAVALVAGCGGGGSSSGDGTVKVALTDDVNPEMDEVMVSIREVRLVPADMTGDEEDFEHPLVASYNPPMQVNVLDLKFQQELLGEASVPAGDYAQIRLVLTEDGNYITLSSDPATQIPLQTPSGQQSGLKVLGQFTVTQGQVQAIVLDFDPNRAIVQAGNSGNWNFKPTGIRVVQVEDVLTEYGSLSGRVVEVAVDPGTGSTTETVVVGAKVSVKPVDRDVVVASNTVNEEDGSFRLFVPGGEYEVMVEAEGYEMTTILDDSYLVVKGEDTALEAVIMAPEVEEASEEEVPAEGPAEETPAETPAA